MQAQEWSASSESRRSWRALLLLQDGSRSPYKDTRFFSGLKDADGAKIVVREMPKSSTIFMRHIEDPFEEDGADNQSKLCRI